MGSKSRINAISKYRGKIQSLTTDQMIEVDRLMIEKYKIELIQMMENAGRCLAMLARSKFLAGKKKRSVVILAGTGGNGGGALVCARRLFGWGYQVQVVVTNQRKMTPIPSHQLGILRNMGVSVEPSSKLDSIESPSLIIDGVIGYSLSGNPRGPEPVLYSRLGTLHISIWILCLVGMDSKWFTKKRHRIGSHASLPSMEKF